LLLAALALRVGFGLLFLFGTVDLVCGAFGGQRGGDSLYINGKELDLWPLLSDLIVLVKSPVEATQLDALLVLYFLACRTTTVVARESRLGGTIIMLNIAGMFMSSSNPALVIAGLHLAHRCAWLLAFASSSELSADDEAPECTETVYQIMAQIVEQNCSGQLKRAMDAVCSDPEGFGACFVPVLMDFHVFGEVLAEPEEGIPNYVAPVGLPALVLASCVMMTDADRTFVPCTRVLESMATPAGEPVCFLVIPGLLTEFLRCLWMFRRVWATTDGPNTLGAACHAQVMRVLLAPNAWAACHAKQLHLGCPGADEPVHSLRYVLKGMQGMSLSAMIRVEARMAATDTLTLTSLLRVFVAELLKRVTSADLEECRDQEGTFAAVFSRCGVFVRGSVEAHAIKLGVELGVDAALLDSACVKYEEHKSVRIWGSVPGSSAAGAAGAVGLVPGGSSGGGAGVGVGAGAGAGAGARTPASAVGEGGRAKRRMLQSRPIYGDDGEFTW